MFKWLMMMIAMMLSAIQAQAAITYDAATGFAGTIDMTAYDSAIPIVVTVIAIVIATGLGIKALLGAKRA